jgi:hypothetical protein
MKLPFFILWILVSFSACAPHRPASVPGLSSDPSPVSFRMVSGKAGPDDIGLFLAGLPVHRGAALSRLQQTGEYQIHHREMSALWSTAGRRVNSMRIWAGAELAPVSRGGSVFYPFGGPDLLYANVLFPAAKTYALMGLEPVGDVPALEALPPAEVLAALPAFREAVRTQLFAGYYVTENMRSDLAGSVLRGVTPILLGTVALTGGKVESVGGISAGGKPGVVVQFRDAAGMRHNAYYVAGDLSNSGFGAGYRQWLAGLGGNATYFKAASYLMHDNRFSQARDFFLSQSHVVLQDDSGIPFRHFAKGWALRFYGNYERPMDLFAKYQQDDLRQAYAAHPTAPLLFGASYQFRQGQGNLLLAIKR